MRRAVVLLVSLMLLPLGAQTSSILINGSLEGVSRPAGQS